MLLIIEALLLILAALGQDHRAAAAAVEKKFPLDMAQNSVDDQYEGCREKMSDLVETKYMKQEMSNPKSKFAIAWKLAENNYKPPGDSLTKNHSIAIYVYTNSGFEVYKEFNEADRNDKKRYKNKTFKWYSLHFLLTDAIQILKKTQNKCYSTYRGTNVKFKQNVRNKKVRFGSFTSSSINHNRTKFFGNVSCFEINTCEGAEVTKYSKLPQEKEVLIPPYETFKVTAVKKRGQQDLWCDTVYTLKSSGKRSDLNCALFKKPTKTITKYYVEH
ncbi:GPI-linked NAD(P)(+)--arginine ADP-ribosyltransferase 1-like [Onychostoma macrolepis]|uniref:GPI-linked NAD(P)(+)--arginine ADP-ribosyltransferase 1-like n=1 Tax=Onychostoma macrolepis TaxID=369639 RepID=UPI00272D6D6A|nr:GPI-linked NAD(P)(+)--arginine ADP-ribosyltransferase 1-like [Onychostoma macrolepis]XP_058627590.1 GPI-linked NAD(P)(+)--arginine ADP-ribosyltransferase 1-like [Onychostoma macrolepis]